MRKAVLIGIILAAGIADVRATVMATINVTTPLDVGGDPANCTLREAFANVNKGGKDGNNSCKAAVTTLTDEATQINLNGYDVTLQDEIWHSSNYAAVTNGSISGDKKHRIFHLAGDGTALFLEHVQLRDGFTEGAGGAIIVESEAHLSTSAVVMKNCHANGNGGLIAFYGGGFLAIEFTALYNGVALGEGGALYFAGDDVSIKNSKISGNTSFEAGGGLYFGSGTQVWVQDSRIEQNSVAENINGAGGGVSSSAFSLTFMRVNIEGNSVDHGVGGGIHIVKAEHPAEIYNSRIFDNTAGAAATGDEAGADGGGIFANGAFLMHRTSVSFNYAHDVGGGIGFGSGTSPLAPVLIDNSSFIYNFARTGAGLSVSSFGSDVTANSENPFGEDYSFQMLNNTFKGNYGESQIFLPDPVVTSDNTILFINNIVDGSSPPCEGAVKRLRVKRLNDSGPDVFNSQWPDSSCGSAISVASNATGNQSSGGYFQQPYALTLLKTPADAVVCTAVGDDQFGNPRQCLLGAVEALPQSVFIDPPVYSP